MSCTSNSLICKSCKTCKTSLAHSVSNTRDNLLTRPIKQKTQSIQTILCVAAAENRNSHTKIFRSEPVQNEPAQGLFVWMDPSARHETRSYAAAGIEPGTATLAAAEGEHLAACVDVDAAPHRLLRQLEAMQIMPGDENEVTFFNCRRHSCQHRSAPCGSVLAQPGRAIQSSLETGVDDNFARASSLRDVQNALLQPRTRAHTVDEQLRVDLAAFQHGDRLPEGMLGQRKRGH